MLIQHNSMTWHDIMLPLLLLLHNSITTLGPGVYHKVLGVRRANIERKHPREA